jgi:hypothetical protein
MGLCVLNRVNCTAFVLLCAVVLNSCANKDEPKVQSVDTSRASVRTLVTTFFSEHQNDVRYKQLTELSNRLGCGHNDSSIIREKCNNIQNVKSELTVLNAQGALSVVDALSKSKFVDLDQAYDDVMVVWSDLDNDPSSSGVLLVVVLAPEWCRAFRFLYRTNSWEYQATTPVAWNYLETALDDFHQRDSCGDEPEHGYVTWTRFRSSDFTTTIVALVCDSQGYHLATVMPIYG